MRRTAVLFMMFVLVAGAASAQRMHSVGRNAGHAFTDPSVTPGAFDPTPCLFILGLSDAQRLQIRQILDAEQPTINTLTQQISTDRNALLPLVNAATPDSCAIGTAYMKIVADNKAFAAEMTKLRTAIEGILTPDQKSKLDGCMAAIANLGGMHP